MQIDAGRAGDAATALEGTPEFLGAGTAAAGEFLCAE